jgi:pyridoxamine 5'-phosphate oxidase
LIHPDPIERFHEVYALAEKIDRSVLPDPSAMALGTVGDDGNPSVRIVLLKAYDERGFVFYTNYEGRKGRDLLARSRAALCFYWATLDIQVRIEGSVAQVADDEADAYFASRHRMSQVGAWASRQSEPIESPGALEKRVSEYEKKFDGQKVPRPPHWSGFRVLPEKIEFWKGQPNRLHERHLYTRAANGWKIETLYP